MAELIGSLVVVIMTGALLFGYGERKTTLKRCIIGLLASGVMVAMCAPFSLPSCTGQTPVTSWLVPGLCLGIAATFIPRWDGVALAAMCLFAMTFILSAFITGH